MNSALMSYLSDLRSIEGMYEKWYGSFKPKVHVEELPVLHFCSTGECNSAHIVTTLRLLV